MSHTVWMETPLGLIEITETDGSITEVSLAKDAPKITAGWSTPLLKEAKKQITEYLEGKRKIFDLPLDARGTEFQKTVWQALRDIPYGETRSYAQVAEMIGRPGASRAVGMANRKNPILILTPCHRVVGRNGGLVGYAAGLPAKEKLLDLERAHTGH